MIRPSHFFTWLLATVLVATVPLLGLHAWTLYRDLDDGREKAYADVRLKSTVAAKGVVDALDRAERLLAFVAAHDDVRGLEPQRCMQFLRGLERIDRVHAAIAVLGPAGQMLCTSVVRETTSSEGGSEWLAQALADSDVHLGKPAIDPITNRPTAPLSMPVRGPDGATRAIAVVSLDLLALEESVVGDWPAAGGVLALVDQEDHFLVRSPQTAKWLGRTASNAARSMRARSPDQIIVAPGVDSIERVFASTPVSKHRLRVIASIPAEVLMAPSRSKVLRALTVAGLALLLAGLLAYRGARAMARPVRSLAGAAKDFAAGRQTATADESLPGEFKALAAEMNAMHLARQHSEASAGAAERRALRLSRFYEASSRANQAIVRLKEPEELYDTICRVCVETGQASMAWIGLVQGQRLRAVAWAGAARSYTDAFGTGLDLSTLAQPAGGPLGASVLEGQIRVVNDYLHDDRTLLFRANAAPFNVRASVIAPFSRAGAVVGTLNLYAQEPDFFDAGVVRLLAEMVGDISFALDNFERAAVQVQTQAEVLKRASQLSGIVESAMDPIITVDVAQRIIVFNGAAARVFRIKASDAIGHPLDRFIPAKFRGTHAGHVMTHSRGSPDSGDAVASRCLTGLRADGTEFPMEASISRTGLGDELQMTVVLRDVTGVREAEQLRLAAGQAEAANLAKTQFLSRMSHELRTPLNAVLGFSQLLQEAAKDKLNERERRHLDLIFLAGAHLRALVDDVLDVSAIESGQLSLTLRDFDLTTLLDGVVRMSETAAREGSIRLVSAFAHEEPVTLRTDPVRLRQVMLNLVSNAIKYNQPGGTATIGIEAVYGSVGITVTDTGMGMSQKQLANLCQPYNRLGREGSEIAGSGIGMALVRQLVERLGGSMNVESEPGVGTVVRVQLPKAKIAQPLISASAAGAQDFDAPAADDTDPSGLVLHVEDNPVNVILVENMLRRWPGVQVVAAMDGASGIEQAAALSPDLLLLDMNLPDMSGLDVLRALRSNPSTSHLCVVALSASTLQEDVLAAEAAGARAYWTKPVDVLSFQDGIRALLERAVAA
ncbi:MAG: GAF domain-containing protein [Chitinophagaceae bacterium]|nr:GAF domain-containing protein [Rubrivivax sp.]